MDVLFEEAEADRPPAPSRSPARSFPDPSEVDRAAALLAAAERPAAVAGSGVWWDDAAPALADLAERAQMPVFLNGSGRGSLPPDHPLFFQHARGAALAAATRASSAATASPTSRSRPTARRPWRHSPIRFLRQASAVPGWRRCETPSRRGGTASGPQSSRTRRRSTTTGSARSSTACSIPARS
jgi:hypothetical protein